MQRGLHTAAASQLLSIQRTAKLEESLNITPQPPFEKSQPQPNAKASQAHLQAAHSKKGSFLAWLKRFFSSSKRKKRSKLAQSCLTVAGSQNIIPEISSALERDLISEILACYLPAEPLRMAKEVPAQQSPRHIVTLESICRHGEPRKHFRSLHRIGSGASGTVYSAIRISDNYRVAIKIMNLKKQQKPDMILNEIQILQSIKHPNIVKFYDSFLYKGRVLSC